MKLYDWYDKKKETKMVEKKTFVYLLFAEQLFKLMENKAEDTEWIKRNWQF